MAALMPARSAFSFWYIDSTSDSKPSRASSSPLYVRRAVRRISAWNEVSAYAAD